MTPPMELQFTPGQLTPSWLGSHQGKRIGTAWHTKSLLCHYTFSFYLCERNWHDHLLSIRVALTTLVTADEDPWIEICCMLYKWLLPSCSISCIRLISSTLVHVMHPRSDRKQKSVICEVYHAKTASMITLRKPANPWGVIIDEHKNWWRSMKQWKVYTRVRLKLTVGLVVYRISESMNTNQWKLIGSGTWNDYVHVTAP